MCVGEGIPARPPHEPAAAAWPPEPISTPRLVLRAATDADAALIERLLTDPVVRRHLGGPVEANAVAGRVSDTPWRGVFTVELAAAHEPIGLIHIGRYRTGDIDLSYEFLPEWWGAGYATEGCMAALDWAFTGVARGVRIIAVTQDVNEASIGLLERLGMTVCDRFIEFGEPQVMMQLTRP
jgi:RimJ/RimL family protein N-acetyltransferase